MFTEQEASKLVCPTSRTPEKYCIGSRCMAWRWDEPVTEGEKRRKKSDDKRGYCGLAGAA